MFGKSKYEYYTGRVEKNRLFRHITGSGEETMEELIDKKWQRIPSEFVALVNSSVTWVTPTRAKQLIKEKTK